MEIVDVKPQVTVADLNDVETSIGVFLPPELRVHYLHSNGGRPVPSAFVKNGEIFSVQEFLPIKYGMRGERFEDTYRDLVDGNPLFPQNLIPFACDAGGDYFCYSTQLGEEGRIFFYQSDYYDDPARATVFLAESLQKFLDFLVPSE